MSLSAQLGCFARVSLSPAAGNIRSVPLNPHGLSACPADEAALTKINSPPARVAAWLYPLFTNVRSAMVESEMIALVWILNAAGTSARSCEAGSMG